MSDNSALDSIKMLPAQIRQTLENIEKLDFSPIPAVKNIAIAGMGGSIYNYHVIRSLFKNELALPLIAVNEYGMPASVGKDTLFIASSYSGSTEEVVYNLKQAYEKGAQCVVLTAGGEIAEFSKKHNIPLYQFDPINNPSGQPRMGQGYMIFGVIGLLSKIGLLQTIPIEEVLKEIETLEQHISTSARACAQEIGYGITIYVAAEHLAGNAHIIRNQTNETAKAYADYHLISEMNHHLMEGLKNPKDKKLMFIFFESQLYFPRIQERFALTRDVVEKNEISIVRYSCQGKSKIVQVLEVLMWGGYLTYFLSEKYGENPNAIPWVDYFKEKLGKMV